MTRVRFIPRACLVALCYGLLSSSALAAAAPKEPVVRVGSLAPLPVYWPLYFARDKGLFAAHGIRVQFTFVHDDADCIRALVAGSLDVCSSGIDAIVRAADAGANVRIIAGLLDKNPTFLIGNPKIHSIANLRGKKLAVLSPQGGSTVAILSMLADAGLKPGDYATLAVGGSAARFAALESGQVDATILPPPNAFIAMDKGFRVLGNAAQSKNGIYGEILAARPGLSPQANATLASFVAAVKQAAAFLVDPRHQSEAIANLSSGSIKMKPKYAQRTYDLLLVNNKAIPGDATESIATVENVIRLMKTYTGYTAAHSATYYVDSRFLAR